MLRILEGACGHFGFPLSHSIIEFLASRLVLALPEIGSYLLLSHRIPKNCGDPASSKSRAQQGKESSEAMAPLAYPSAEAQEHIGQERRPNLPAYCIGIMSQEVGQLEGLLDLFEKHFDVPPAPIQIDNRLRAPLQVVRQKFHLPPFPIHLHHRHDPPQPRRVEPTRSRGFHLHHVVTQNIADASPLIPPDHSKLHPLLSSRHPGYPALEQLEEVQQL